VTGPLDPRLIAVAAWETDALIGAVAVLDEVAGALPSWRYRVEAVGRALEGVEVWSGPAARVAATGVLGISAAAAVLAVALEASTDALGRLAGEARTAAAAAQAALARPAGDPSAVALAEEALAAAARTAAAARDAGEALAGVGVRDAFAPTRLGSLSRDLVVPADVPPAAPPADRAAWWVALSAPAQRALISRHPAVVGALDGLPAWARDRANRLVLDRALAAPEPSAVARAAAAEIARLERAGRPVQVHLFDERGLRVALGLGDLDSADSVALLVPGLATTPDDDLTAVAADVGRVLDAAAAVPGAGAVAGIAWLGYRPPRGLGIPFRGAARRGGRALDGTLDGLAAARRAVGREGARTTVLGHSYGTVVVDEAADAPGRLAADAVVLLGSPGMDPDRTPAYEVGAVHDATSAADPVSWLGWFGVSTWADRYGARALPVDAGTGHAGYLDPGGSTLVAIGGVVAGTEGTR
jgi:Alpha/beta hydrolase